jgi:hypothetical protein
VPPCGDRRRACANGDDVADQDAYSNQDDNFHLRDVPKIAREAVSERLRFFVTVFSQLLLDAAILVLFFYLNRFLERFTPQNEASIEFALWAISSYGPLLVTGWFFLLDLVGFFIRVFRTWRKGVNLGG